jgi:hypothetical protein
MGLAEAGWDPVDVRGLLAGASGVRPPVPTTTPGCAVPVPPDSSAHAGPLLHPVTMAAPTPKATAKPADPAHVCLARHAVCIAPKPSRRAGNDRSP